MLLYKIVEMQRWKGQIGTLLNHRPPALSLPPFVRSQEWFIYIEIQLISLLPRVMISLPIIGH